MATNPWDANAFKQVVGRDPNDTETQYYSGAGDNWLDEVKKNTPGYTDPNQTNNGGIYPGLAAAGTGIASQFGQKNSGGSTPSYYNASDPTHQAVWSAFQAKGMQPRDSSDFNYWVDHINQSGGLENGYQNTGGTGTWADRMASGNGGVGDYRTGGAPIQGGTAGGGSRYGSNVMGGALGTGDANSLYADLMARAHQSLSFDPNADAIARPQIDAFNAARQRADKSTLSQVAEQAGANTNLDAMTRSAGEATAQATGGFTAQLGQNELNARRQEIQNALSGAQGLLTSQQQMALQEEMANLDRQQRGYEFDINDQYRNSPLAWA